MHLVANEFTFRTFTQTFEPPTPQVPDVRKYALELCKEMYRFLGKRVQDMVHENESIREAQKKELDAMFAMLPTGTQSHDDDTHVITCR